VTEKLSLAAKMASMLLAIYPLERIPMELTGRTIRITGGSAGIGLAFALKFLELGNQVIVTGRRDRLSTS